MNLSRGADPTKQPCNHVPLCVKGLAAAFGVGADYIYAMRDAGAPFWGRVSTIAAIMEWWGQNPSFSRRNARKSNARPIPAPIAKVVVTKKAVARNGEVLVL